ncbi:MAG TPA: sigma 54-interacting transcriptional regulator [Polyangiaceae bacterium]|jgi:DNA-binding NtrC family response regulator|nr:sigma 54-interacting transcriptional regulator [Polyangiaceae bacterium]
MSPPIDEGTKRIRLDPQGLRVLSFDLVVVDGPSRGARVHVGGGVARVGSAPGNHLALADDTVSRVHCELRAQADAIVVKDCGSTNGTLIEGVLVREGDVKPGTTVRVGNSSFRIEPAVGASFLPISESTSFGELVGTSLEMRRVYAMLERIAGTAATLLIEGETGTGKDVAARSLHSASRRADGPFVPVDCGAIPENLVESELFGHVRGAFSGAVNDRKGVFEEAHGGTLFLDEIGEMPLSVQPKLLRAIETRSIRRVGSNSERPVDVRIVAATNRSLASAANAGTFREDLYYRLAVVEVKLPPLRARGEDIALLARHFYERFAGADATLPAAFLDMLATRAWPGNVRELRNFMERSVSLGFVTEPPGAPAPAASRVAPGAALETVVPLHLPLKEARQAWTESFESVYVRALLGRTAGNVTRAAEQAGVNRRFLQRLMARLGLRGGEGDDEEK